MKVDTGLLEEPLGYGHSPLSGWPDSGYKQDSGDSYEAIFGVSVPGTHAAGAECWRWQSRGADASARRRRCSMRKPIHRLSIPKIRLFRWFRTLCHWRLRDDENLFATQNEMGADLCKPTTAQQPAGLIPRCTMLICQQTHSQKFRLVVRDLTYVVKAWRSAISVSDDKIWLLSAAIPIAIRC